MHFIKYITITEKDVSEVLGIVVWCTPISQSSDWLLITEISLENNG